VPDISRDMKKEDPCYLYEEKTVKAEEIEVDGEKYYYKADDKKPLGYIFYEFSKDLGGWIPIADNDLRVYSLVDKLRELLKVK
jgi:predicted acetyltransferase